MPLASFQTVALLCLAAAPLAAQGKATKAKLKAPAANVAAPSLVGAWSGTATVPLPDSAVVVPVFYTFTQTGTTIGGSAMVPGQGSGPISNVVRDGARIQFRVTAPEARLLEHDGKFGADGAIEGLVNMNNQPVAKFRIAPKPPTKPVK
jgi:hypothetical protein